MILRILTVAALCCCLWNCGLLTEPTPLITAPAQLNPDSVFAKGEHLTYTWTEGWTLGKQDTSFTPRNFQVLNQGDTVIAGDTLLQLRFTALDGYPFPGSVITHLGFNPSKTRFDTNAIPDPGPELGFPTYPKIGWRDTLTSGDFHFVRELKGLDTISWHGAHLQSWAFTDTTYWNGTAVATALYSVGRSGLLQLSLQRPNFNAHGDTTTKVLWLQVTQQ
jgi:hypothetical protein